MEDFFSLLGALLANLVLIAGLLYLPPVGIHALENIYTLVWVTFGLLINLGFLRHAVKINRRRKISRAAKNRHAPSAPPEKVRRRMPMA